MNAPYLLLYTDNHYHHYNALSCKKKCISVPTDLSKRKVTMQTEQLISIILGAIQLATSSKILAIFPSGTKSHDLFTSRLAQELHTRGHDLTVLTVYPELYSGMETIYLKETQNLWLSEFLFCFFIIKRHHEDIG